VVIEMKKENFQKTLLILFLLLFIVPLSYATVPDIVLNQKKAVVTIYINDKEGKQIITGSGFIIDSNGIIATNYHVISKWLEALENILFIKMENGAYFPIEELLTSDEENDIAIFKVEGKELPTVKLATDYEPKQGEGVIVIGSPIGLETTVSDGIISNIRGKGGLIQITAPISPGSSGSPIFNSKGEIIGVATFLIQGGQNLNFAIPVKYVATLLNESKKPKKKIKPALEPAPTPETPATAPSPEPVDELEKAKAELRKNPDSAVHHFNLGIAYGNLDMYKEEIEAYKQAIRIKPDYAEAHYNLGIVYGKLGKREAVESFKQAIRIKPDFAEAHLNLGVAYGKLGMHKEAIEAYKQAIRIKPDFAEAHRNLGVAYHDLDMYREALEAYKQAIRIKPDFAEAHYNLGIVYGKLGKREAVESFKQAIRIKPDFAEAYYNLGVMYDKLGMYREAMEAYKQTIKIKPDDAEAHSGLSLAYGKLDMYKEAIEACKQAIRIKPDFAEAHYILGLSYLIINDRGSALEEYKILKELDTEKANELFNLIYK
jgi:tetratricopeptide (TPR) repeat protein